MTLFNDIWVYVADSLDNDVIFQILLISIIIDFITGFARAVSERKVNSTTGINGWIRHGLVIIITSVVSYFASVLGANWFSYAFAIGFIIEYIVSIAENWDLLGYPLPKNIKEMLDKLNAPKFKDFSITIEHDKNNDNKLKELNERLVDKNYSKHKRNGDDNNE